MNYIFFFLNICRFTLRIKDMHIYRGITNEMVPHILERLRNQRVRPGYLSLVSIVFALSDYCFFLS